MWHMMIRYQILVLLFIMSSYAVFSQSEKKTVLSLSYGMGIDVLDFGRAHSLNATLNHDNMLLVYRYLNGKSNHRRGFRGGSIGFGGVDLYPIRRIESQALMVGLRFWERLNVTIGASYTCGVTEGETITSYSSGWFTTTYVYAEEIYYTAIGLAYGISSKLKDFDDGFYGIELFTEGEWNPYVFYNHTGFRIFINLN